MPQPKRRPPAGITIVTVSMPTSLVAYLDQQAKRLGLSRRAYIRMLACKDREAQQPQAAG